MTSFHQQIRDIENLHSVIRLSGSKYLTYTIFIDNVLNFRTSDGYQVWNHSMTDKGIVDAAKEAELDLETYIIGIRVEFPDMKLTKDGDDLRLYSPISKSSFTLTKLQDSESSDEIQRLLFRYAERTIAFEKASPAPSPTKSDKGDTEAKSGVNKRVGMSVINPASRKRKAAQGVVYE